SCTCSVTSLSTTIFISATPRSTSSISTVGTRVVVQLYRFGPIRIVEDLLTSRTSARSCRRCYAVWRQTVGQGVRGATERSEATSMPARVTRASNTASSFMTAAVVAPRLLSICAAMSHP
ncbi:MAG: hypothetical protein QOJ56_5235, partial [Mycobacterium sp.]|nr:hypothetical protein [Mycobacterium sp.]MDT7769067.1 hypothetical protein [Mycobacterium sp.]